MLGPRRIGLRLEYDGTDFHGWQRQASHRTVQGTVEDVLRRALDRSAIVDGASRTDAGVHARDQLAACTLSHPILPRGLIKALNTRLPADVKVRVAWEASPDFEPRFAPTGKTYTYRIYRDKIVRPLIDRYAWRVGVALDVEPMVVAAQSLVGTHDFTAFAASDSAHTQAVRTLVAVQVTTEPDACLAITVDGTAFMKQMVRNIVGTLYDVGRGRLKPAQVATILAGRDRNAAGPTAPGRGLTLERVWYTPPEATQPVRS